MAGRKGWRAVCRRRVAHVGGSVASKEAGWVASKAGQHNTGSMGRMGVDHGVRLVGRLGSPSGVPARYQADMTHRPLQLPLLPTCVKPNDPIPRSSTSSDIGVLG